jgi:uridine phosphorylase
MRFVKYRCTKSNAMGPRGAAVATDQDGLPLLWNTTDSASAFDPADWFAYCSHLNNRPVPALPALAVQSVINEPMTDIHLEIVEHRYGVRRDDFTLAGHPFAIFQHDGHDIVVAASAKGSYAAGGLDELIALGARQVILLNVGGALSDEPHIGDLVAVDAALRDDGVSLHYQAPSRYAYPSAQLASHLEAAAHRSGRPVHTGSVWSTTAHFRLSQRRLQAFRAEGCIAIENETAAAFSLGRYRNADVACLLHVGLTLRHDRFEVPGTANAIYGLPEAEAQLDTALAALVAKAESPAGAERP